MHSEGKSLTCFQFHCLHFTLHLLVTCFVHLGKRKFSKIEKTHLLLAFSINIYLVEKYVDNSGSWILQIAGALEAT